jgi:hypothetical protein
MKTQFLHHLKNTIYKNFGVLFSRYSSFEILIFKTNFKTICSRSFFQSPWQKEAYFSLEKFMIHNRHIYMNIDDYVWINDQCKKHVRVYLK